MCALAALFFAGCKQNQEPETETLKLSDSELEAGLVDQWQTTFNNSYVRLNFNADRTGAIEARYKWIVCPENNPDTEKEFTGVKLKFTWSVSSGQLKLENISHELFEHFANTYRITPNDTDPKSFTLEGSSNFNPTDASVTEYYGTGCSFEHVPDTTEWFVGDYPIIFH